MGQESEFWQVNKGIARLKLGPATFELDLSRPFLGMKNVSFRGRQLSSFSLFQIIRSPAARLRDHYLRGNDLIVTYSSEPTDEITVQICWQALSADTDVASIGLMVSVQTKLLDSDVEVNTQTIVPADTAFRLATVNSQLEWLEIASDRTDVNADTDPLLVRMANLRVSYFEMTTLNDQGRVAAVFSDSTPRMATIRNQFFDGRLEKGVIRRARACAHLMPTKDDHRAALDCFERFQAEPIPLTA